MVKNTELNHFQVSWENSDGNLDFGPLGVLWSLIESYKVHIFNVSLNKLTNDFLAFIKIAESFSIELGIEYVLMSSHLIYLKSKELLPDELKRDEESEIFQSLPEELVEKLLEYKKFQYLSEKLSLLSKEQYLERETGFTPIEKFAIEKKGSPEELLTCYLRIFQIDDSIAKKEFFQLKRFQTISIHNTIIKLQELIIDKKYLHFSELLNDRMEKLEVVVYFLAMLELVKNNIVSVKQDQHFSDIILSLI